jgi:hypothetical protein
MIASYIMNKRSHCVCERDLFPDDCDCGFEEEEEQRQAARRVRLAIERKQFLAEYPSIIFPSYKIYKESNGRLGFCLLGSPPTWSERNKMITDELMRFQKTLRKPTILDWTHEKEWRATEMCLRIVHEYNFLGYREFKNNWDSGNFYGEGRLLRNHNIGDGDFIGEVMSYVCPSLELERIIDPFVKAIAIIETYRNKDSFIDAWNDFFHNSPEQCNSRFVYLGYVQDRYIGWNSPFVKKQNCARQKFVQLTNRQFERFWDEAVMTVKALLVIDCLKEWAHVRYTSRGLYNDSFAFDF